MAAANTYVAISPSYTLASTATSITFSSIPATYTDLVLVCNPKEGGGDLVWAQVNGDTGANYSDTVIYGNGTTATSTRHSAVNWIYAFLTSDTANKNATLHFMNYANTTTNKTVLVRSNSTSDYVQASVHLWRSTSAISSILLSAQGTFAIGSTFALYGILAA